MTLKSNHSHHQKGGLDEHDYTNLMPSPPPPRKPVPVVLLVYSNYAPWPWNGPHTLTVSTASSPRAGRNSPSCIYPLRN
ncbi:Hypothetical protein FKW44_014174 [Caligus rogercresseyi]|uniref:Uncharacterized protein n=1 Tax=Caligus rogercresseyi TaxID=217165 RepID=A0A7T8GZD8_CALRO|nr:Hypothetical protein FKW44_014174 [Caligus rogercresseyi]